MGGAEDSGFERIIESAGKRLTKNSTTGKKYWVVVADAQIPGKLVGMTSDSIDEIMNSYSLCLNKYILRGNDVGDLDRYCIAFFEKENNCYVRKTLNNI